MSGVGVADDVIRSFFERWKNLEAEKAAISEDLRELFAEMKGSGFDTKVARKVFRDKTVDQNERAEFEAIYDLYWSALSGPRAGRARERLVDHYASTAKEADSNVNETGRFAVSTTSEKCDAETGEILDTEHEPQPSPMAGKAAASTPPEVAAGNQPETAIEAETGCAPVEPCSNQHGDGNGLRLKGKVDGSHDRPSDQPGVGVRGNGALAEDGFTQREDDASPALSLTTSHSSDLHDGRLQAVPAPALDESRDSAAGVEAPAAPVNYPAPGITTYERCPPEPVRWHEYADCFPETTIDLGSTGVQKPIVKIGNVILDGRSRYHAARDAGIAYPVFQYAGPDPLTDVIRWNLGSRDMSEKDKRAVASRLAKLAPDRTDEIMSMFGLEMAEATA